MDEAMDVLDDDIDISIYSASRFIEFSGQNITDLIENVKKFTSKLGADNGNIVEFNGYLLGIDADYDIKDDDKCIQQFIFIRKISSLSNPDTIPRNLSNINNCDACRVELCNNRLEVAGSFCKTCQDVFLEATRFARKAIQHKYKKEYTVAYPREIWGQIFVNGCEVVKAHIIVDEFMEILGVKDDKFTYGDFIITLCIDTDDVAMCKSGELNRIEIAVYMRKRDNSLKYISAKKCADLGITDNLPDDALDQVLEFDHLLAIRYLF
ncbi:hypothetical protein F-liban_200 [Faustovirus]|nr:hypothetical protein F-liban_200 [Faustovirus]SME64873.1 Hypothetical protein FSTVST1_191 [Faustovirus ST1]